MKIRNCINNTGWDLFIVLIVFLLPTVVLAQSVSFSEVASNLPQMPSNMDWGDYDNDGDLDLALIATTSVYKTVIYRNDGGVFTDINAGLLAGRGDVAWGDFDGDGDLDLAVAGCTSSDSASCIYRNDAGQFVNIQAGLPRFSNAAAKWCDYDADGDLDLIISGYRDNKNVLCVFRNNGGTFVDTGIACPVSGVSSIECGDFDNDGDPDILLSTSGIVRVLRNQSGLFSDAGILTGKSMSTMAWGDYDGDGDPDLAEATVKAGSAYLAAISIYRNDNGTLIDTGEQFPEAQYNRLAWGDCDNDGDPDLIVTYTTSSGYVCKVYANNNGKFTDTGANISASASTGIKVADYDNDGDLDFSTSGSVGYLVYRTQLFSNNLTNANTAPTAPSGLSATSSGGKLEFSWNVGSDNQTPSTALTYNLRIGTRPGASDVLSCMADSLSGRRLIAAPGNALQQTRKALSLPSGRYYWSVQSIDSIFAGSSWADEQVVDVNVNEISGRMTDASGNGISGVIVRPDRCNPTTTDSSGSYSVRVPSGWSGKVVPDGLGYESSPISRSYADITTNQTNQDYTMVRTFTSIDNTLTGLYGGSVSWGDYDGDGDLDLLIMGNKKISTTDTTPISQICTNDGNGSFSEQSGCFGTLACNGAWADYDNDGDLDVAICGTKDLIQPSCCEIFKNDNGIFSDINAGIAKCSGPMAWGDYDNDGDLDIAVSGYGPNAENTTTIYRNDNGVFAASGTEAIPYSGTPAWVNYDNDPDPDVFISGHIFKNRAALYHGCIGSFIDSGIGLPTGPSAWGDYDADGDLDYAVDAGDRVGTRLFRNDSGSFTEVASGLIGTADGFLAWGDYNNDGYPDIAITGTIRTSDGITPITKIYRNNGDGTFTEISTDITGVRYGCLAWGDCDNDGDLDLAIIGDSNPTSSTPVTKIYRNNCAIPNNAPQPPVELSSSVTGKNTVLQWNGATDDHTKLSGLAYNLRIGTEPGKGNIFSSMTDLSSGRRYIAQPGPIAGTSWTLQLPAGTYYWSVQSVDSSFAGSAWSSEQQLIIDSDRISGHVRDAKGNGIRSVVISTSDGADSYITGSDGYYEIRVASGWSGAISAHLEGCDFSPDNHSYSDVKQDISDQDYSGIALFVECDQAFPGVVEGSAAWGDYDNDGDLDLAIIGTNSSNNLVVNLYANDGTGYFGSYPARQLPGLASCSMAWGDSDADGDLDLALCGTDSHNCTRRILYSNKDGYFTSAENISAYPSNVCWVDSDNDGSMSLWSGSTPTPQFAQWADYDNDGDMDQLLTWIRYDSNDGLYHPDTTLATYNNGSVSRTNDNLVNVKSAASAWADYDNDGDLDLALAGDTESGLVTKIYYNDNGKLMDAGMDLPGVKNCSLAWGDYDNDGDSDLAIAGISESGSPITRVFRNDKTAFVDSGINVIGVSSGTVAWGDCDNDGDLDLLVAGLSANGPVAKIYRNFTARNNVPPSVPSGLNALAGGGKPGAVFTWSASSDAETPAGGLSYNLRVGTKPGSNDVFSGMADNSTGVRRIPALGNAQKMLSWSLSLPAGTYYWSVQAIDPSYATSAWAEEQQVTVGNLVKITGHVWARPRSIVRTNDGRCTKVDENEYYEMWVPSGWSGTITPIPSPADFSCYSRLQPASRSYDNVVSDETDQDYTGKLIGVNLDMADTVAWGDYDNDGDMDLFIDGTIWGTSGNVNICRIYNNDNGTFVDIGSNLPILYPCTAAWGDVDGDGDLDLAITGRTSEYGSTDSRTLIYRNDSGTFTNIIADFAVGYNGLTLADYDNDGDLDLFVFGSDNSTILRNDNGVFSDTHALLPQITLASADMGDYDGDCDLDLAVSGTDLSTNKRVTKILRNDGRDLFTDINADMIAGDSVAWNDFDNDGDLDLTVQSSNSSALYRNDGGTFIDAQAGFGPAFYKGVAWGDFDNDGDQDLATGYDYYINDNGTFRNRQYPTAGSSCISWIDYDNDGDLDLSLGGYIYRNNCMHANNRPNPPQSLTAVNSVNCVAFSWSAGSDNETPAEGLSYNLRVGTKPGSSNMFCSMADPVSGIRRMPGRGNIQSSGSKLHLPNGTYYWSVQSIDGAFSASPWAPEQVINVHSNKISGHIRNAAGAGIADLILSATHAGLTSVTDETGYYEVIVPDGWSGSITPNSPSFIFSPGSKSYSEVSTDIPNQDFVGDCGLNDLSSGLPGIFGSAIWGDYDGDGDLDVALAGIDDSNNYLTGIYRNDGGKFVSIGANLPQVTGDLAWGDYDKDGDLDLAISGHGTACPSGITRIYRNDGGTFIATDLVKLTGYGSIAWGDYDNDGDLDLAFSGTYTDTVNHWDTKIYRNDNSSFSCFDIATSTYGNVAWGDYDNDGDLDLMLAGNSYVAADKKWQYNIARMYRNDSGTFVNVDVGLTYAGGKPVWVDYDNDGDLDIFSPGCRLLTYRNDGCVFSLVDCGLNMLFSATISCGDYDNDGDSDLAAWWNKNGSTQIDIFRNDDASFVPFISPLLNAKQQTTALSAAWGDCDGDNDLDLLCCGSLLSGNTTRVYRNDSIKQNSRPMAPQQLSEAIESNGLKLKWAAASDAETPTKGLSYNLRVGTTPGKCDVLSPMSNLKSGVRLLPDLGNAQKTTSWPLHNLPSGRYYWSVQAIDTAYTASPWAEERMFVIGNGSVAFAKTAADNAHAIITSVVVTGVFDGFFYVESADRSSGMRVEKSNHGLSVGDVVDVEGNVLTNQDGERYIEAGIIEKHSTP